MNYYDNIVKKFKNISRKKWIKSTCNNHGGVGITFESEIGKKKDSLFFPDFEGIELKCTTKYSNYPLYLFTIAFDGPTFPEINRVVNLYGYPDKDFNNKKVLFTKLSVIKKHIVNEKYKFQLHIDKENEKIFLEVYDKNDILLEKKSFIYLKSIYDHLMTKLSRMAVIYAYKKRENESDYFRYYKLKIYELISFDKFLSLLEEGIIIVDLIARINKSGIDKGRYRNKNLVFSIKKQDVEKLFKKIFELDADKKLSSNFYIMN